MNLGRKEFDTFKAETLSRLNAVENNQQKIVDVLKTLISELTETQSKLAAIEESICSLQNLITENEANNSQKLHEILSTLIGETAKIKKNHNTGMKQVREAINALMLERLLDRAEMLCQVSDKPAAETAVRSSKKTRAKKICPLCGALVLFEDGVCIHCGHKFDLGSSL